ncbi:uncharacterized protein Tco025E_03593 [Trypanosoma conorhini]|uniref:Uncharacterized protein n=1 Tax=Trypanosoma conorhini TaxID=83891 RepID=A0A422PTW0_9TRYP|nr:uncharacterized protein Tco025E_03593 [Trypanosoma conorhini]RNF21150.1 hypothetical protein Tco025E_03593 [Trypanosoma conorhini]
MTRSSPPPQERQAKRRSRRGGSIFYHQHITNEKRRGCSRDGGCGTPALGDVGRQQGRSGCQKHHQRQFLPPRTFFGTLPKCRRLETPAAGFKPARRFKPSNYFSGLRGHHLTHHHPWEKLDEIPTKQEMRDKPLLPLAKIRSALKSSQKQPG